MSKKIKMKWYSDPGHAWLRVPIELVNQVVLLGLKISDCSYKSKRYAYLEEDCDAPAYLDFVICENRHLITTSHTNRQSHIRRKESYNG